MMAQLPIIIKQIPPCNCSPVVWEPDSSFTFVWERTLRPGGQHCMLTSHLTELSSLPRQSICQK